MTASGDLVQHLLEIEEKAAAIVLAAQKEADARLMSADREIRADNEAAIKKAFEQLDADYQAKIAGARDSRAIAIKEYEKTLENISVNQKAFSALFGEYLGVKQEGI
jgi:hypothetical protein